jgi:hypothetical protein
MDEIIIKELLVHANKTSGGAIPANSRYNP